MGPGRSMGEAKANELTRGSTASFPEMDVTHSLRGQNDWGCGPRVDGLGQRVPVTRNISCGMCCCETLIPWCVDGC